MSTGDKEHSGGGGGKQEILCRSSRKDLLLDGTNKERNFDLTSLLSWTQSSAVGLEVLI